MVLEVSLLLDGQLEAGERIRVLEAMESDPALRDRYTVYGLVGDVLRGNSTPDDGFTVRILRRMHEEDVRMEAGYDPLHDPPA